MEIKIKIEGKYCKDKGIECPYLYKHNAICKEFGEQLKKDFYFYVRCPQCLAQDKKEG
jgi:hypothetical protein